MSRKALDTVDNKPKPATFQQARIEKTVQDKLSHVAPNSNTVRQMANQGTSIVRLAPDTRPCGGCERGAPFDGPYDIKRQCRICWLYHNSISSRKVWGGSGQLEQYLSDMEELCVSVSENRFGKKGNLGYKAGNPSSSRIRVTDKEFPNGLAMCPDSHAYAVVKYRLPRDADMFFFSVALNDSAGAPNAPPGVGAIPTALTFQVLGDGKLLWESRPLDRRGSYQSYMIDVIGVYILELRVDCPGPNVNAHAVWLEPRLLLKDRKQEKYTIR
jgi:hypothetical protein